MKCSYCGKFRKDDDLIPVSIPREWFEEIESNKVICTTCIAARVDYPINK